MNASKLRTVFSRNNPILTKLGFGLYWLALFVATLAVAPTAQAAVTCTNTITANVVVLDNPTVFNRLGAQNPNWITYALKRDVIAVDPITRLPTGDVPGTNLTAGNVELRPDKRTRPLVIRSVAGSCLTVEFTNLLAPVANPNNAQQGEVIDPDTGLVTFPGLINNDQVAGRCAGFHATGTELVNGMEDDGSMVGANPGANTGDSTTGAAVCGPGMAEPGGSRTYELYTPHEGAFLINSYGATLGSESSAGNLGLGMFGALNVQPKGSRMYRSQVTEEELRLATTSLVETDCETDDVVGVDCNPGGQPIIDYEAVYPNVAPWIAEGKAGLPILNMLDGNELVHSDINAIIVGSNTDGSFPPSTYPLESVGQRIPQLPNRLEPFREFTSIFHDEQTNSQVFPLWYNNPVLQYTLAGVKDQFMINYGSGGIGSEIIANRLHTGPMHDCADCAYEEFFLASQTVGDPGMLVNFPANTGIEACDPTNILTPECWRQFDDGMGNLIVANPPLNDPGIDGLFGTVDDVNNYALFQEDPSNVHNTYTGDFVKIRNTHAGAFEQHIFHLHNHQWLFNPNDDNANYLDAQEIMPGSGHTYELVNGGAGNRNKTVGDAIFHCHFYPHFAQGMWYHIRNMDTFQRGTVLAVSGATADPQNPILENDPRLAGPDGVLGDDPGTPGVDESLDDLNPDPFHTTPFALRSGQPAAGARALPDAELPDGSPIPAIVPLPGKPMPQMPAKVSVTPVDRGDFGVVAGRTPPNGLGQGPDSAQAIVDYISVAGADEMLNTDDDVSPGFPFWLSGNSCGEGAVVGATPGDTICPEGIVGQRMPTPVLDMLTEAGATANDYNPKQAGGWDGGLPRHSLLGYTSGARTLDTQNRLDFRKVIEVAPPVYFPETGTPLEKVSMAYQAVRNRPSAANNLVGGPTTADVFFVLNGSPPVPAGPFNDPCVDDFGYMVEVDDDLPGPGQWVPKWFDGDDDDATWNEGGRPTEFDGDNPRTYKLANVQIDAVFNKVGHHYSQERIIALWEDVLPTINKIRPPEPLVMRFNSFDCGKILHTNLVPAEFELDDFQVRTPTDIIGQHIHLPKWDLTTGDGAANGWNYEDGALAPLAVQERIHAINEFNVEAMSSDTDDLFPVATLPNPCGDDPLIEGCGTEGGLTHLVAQPHPFFGSGVFVNGHNEYDGARTVIQRILIDPVHNVAGVDRGLGLTFSHDHYGPSTFQQIGLYSTILAQPQGSTWYHNESGEPLYGRPITMRDGTPGGTDGGPTTWQAIIDTPEGSPVPDHREFYFEMSDFQHAYEAGVYVGADTNGRPVRTQIVSLDPFNVTEATAPLIQDTWQDAINPPLKLKAAGGFPDVVTAHGACPGPAGNFDPNIPRPCAEAINISHSSMWVVNYRNEPVGLRVFDPNKLGPDGKMGGSQADGPAGDLALAFQSRNDRAIPQLNTSFGDAPYPTGADVPGAYCQGNDGDGINCDRNIGDPFTPIMRAYEGDEVKVKIQVGATEEQHQTTLHGIRWLSNGSGFGRSPNSGWRNFQSHGISEQFSLQAPLTPALQQAGQTVDYLYAQDATRDGIWLGTWGILRTYGGPRSDLVVLGDNNDIDKQSVFSNARDFDGVCPKDAPVADYDVTAVLANEVLGNNLGVIIPANTAPIDNVGGVLDGPGTLVYNRRGTVVSTVTITEPGLPPEVFAGGAGPLNDPTAMMYVRTEDLMSEAEAAATPLADGGACFNPRGRNAGMFNPTLNGCAEELALAGVGLDGCLTSGGTFDAKLNTCPVVLRPNVPVEPLVLRANAGDCIDVTLRNRLVNKQAVTTADEPVFFADGTPVFSELADGSTPALFVDDTAGGLTEVARNLVVFDLPPDLAGWQDMMMSVTRRIEGLGTGAEMYFFNNNLVRPGSWAGIHPQLVTYDASRDDGVAVGRNQPQLAAPGGTSTARYYAGDIEYVDSTDCRGNQANRRCFEIVATPIEFGASNLLSADRVKQPQKGLFGALVIEPEGATVAEGTLVPDGQGLEVEGQPSPTRPTRAQVTVTAPAGDAGSGGTYREALSIGHKIANLRWADGSAIKNIHQGELGREGAEDSGHAGFNYAMEPSWFRFKLPPDVPFGNAGTPNSFGSIPNQQAFYANALVAGEPNAIPAITGVSAAGDPQTPVFYATADTLGAIPVTDTRMYVLNGASADRDGTFILHGHLWQRDPYVCPSEDRDGDPNTDPTSYLGLPGLCYPDSIGSLALGLNPLGKWMGSQEGMGHVFGHWPILFDAGGTGAVKGDYLYRDYSPSGNRNGQFGILRVE
ncbi:MAG: hypothetical protein OES10_00330 [Gammaproteobacteria bacterium]|nr:hypothetical protein [Gammaproteobacteria bacterium]